MKRIKLLTPVLGLTAIGSTLIPLTSCGSIISKDIPSSYFVTDGNVLKGIKDGVDISGYNRLVVPSDIKIIEENAFKEVFDGNICAVNTVIIPNNVRVIKKGAFAKCYGVSIFDFSAYAGNQVYDLEIESGAFGTINYDWYAFVKINNNLSDVQKDSISSTFLGAQVPAYWLTEPTSGHIELTNIREQYSLDCSGYHEFDVLNGYSLDYKYTAVISRKDGTKGINVEPAGDAQVSSDLKKIKVVSKMVPAIGQEIKNGDWVSFKLTIFCSSKTTNAKIYWVQALEEFKLTFKSSSNN